MSACTFFGHRDCYGLETQMLCGAIEGLIRNGTDTFYVGNQGNFDALVYRCLRKLRKVYPHIRVSVVLAYLPTGRTAAEDLTDTIYPEIEGHPYYAIERRNRWMIETSDECLRYVNQTWGGAYKFALYAKRHGLRVINLGSAEL